MASRLENDENGNTTTSGAFLVGNYSPRTADPAAATASVATGSGTKTGSYKLTGNAIGYFKTNDLVTDSTSTCTVSSVGAAMDTVNVKDCDVNLSSAATLLKLK